MSQRLLESIEIDGDYLVSQWCGREDSNFHVLSDTTTSTLRVYQFRHDRTFGLSAGRTGGR